VDENRKRALLPELAHLAVRITRLPNLWVSFPRFGGRVGCGDHAAAAAGMWARS
jgi:hypothetical protein